MQTTNRNTAGATKHQNVLIVYESAPAREQAAIHCGNLFSIDTTVHWSSSVQLNEPAYRNEMSKQAITADVVVFACSREGDFSQEVKLWLERWLFKRSAREGVIVGLFTKPTVGGGEIACLKEIYLRHAAAQAGLDYLSRLPAEPLRVIPDSLDMYNRRAGEVTSLLQEILNNRITPPPPL